MAWVGKSEEILKEEVSMVYVAAINDNNVAADTFLCTFLIVKHSCAT